MSVNISLYRHLPVPFSYATSISIDIEVTARVHGDDPGDVEVLSMRAVGTDGKEIPLPLEILSKMEKLHVAQDALDCDKGEDDDAEYEKHCALLAMDHDDA